MCDATLLPDNTLYVHAVRAQEHHGICVSGLGSHPLLLDYGLQRGHAPFTGNPGDPNTCQILLSEARLAR